jgi:DNA end-binding protein Ku
MARAIWTGAISFGLVNVPVKLYSAVEQKDVSFHQLQKDTGERIHYKRVTDDSDDEVPYADIVKGYEVDKGQYVVVTPEELESVEPGRSRTVDIEDFVDLDEVDPVYFEKTYYMGPANKDAAKTYELLRKALERTNKVAIARFVMRTKQYLAAVRANGKLLMLETMYFPDEVRDADAVDNLPKGVRLSDRELAMAEQLIESLTSEWEPDRYHDTYRERVLELIQAKAKGEDVVTEEEEQPAKVVDLMAALEASLEQTKGRAASAAGSKKSGGARTKAKGKGSATKSSKGDDYAELSKEELYEKAAAADIPGRSSMTKDDLVHALQEAS